MFKKMWDRMTRKQQTNQKLTRKEQILAELGRGAGTARQLADRTGLKLTIIRTTLTALHNKGLIRDTEDNVNQENIWEVVK